MLDAQIATQNPASASTTPPTATSGLAVDGYLQNSKVVCDANGNGLPDANEGIVHTLADGSFTFSSGCQFGLIVSEGVNADTNLPFLGVLKAPPGAYVVSPLTTLLSAGMSQAQVNTTLGLSNETNVLVADPAASKDGVLLDAVLLTKALVVQQLLQKLAELACGLAGDSSSATRMLIYNEAAIALAKTLKNSSPLIMDGDKLDSRVVNLAGKEFFNALMGTASPVPFGIKNAVASAGGPEALSNASFPGIQLMAQAILNAKGAADITAVTTASQSNQSLTNQIRKAFDDGRLSAEVGAQNSLALGLQLAASLNAPTPTVAGDTGTCETFTEATCLGFDQAYAGLVPFEGLSATLDVDPLKPSNKVAKLVKSPGSKKWAGVTIATSITSNSVDVIDLSVDKIITVRIYASAANETVMLKLETGLNENGVEVQTKTTAANAWQTLIFDFSKPTAGLLNLNLSYNRISVFPAYGSLVTEAKVFYLDELKLKNVAGKLANWTLVWSDEFDGTGLPNASKWDYDTDRNKVGWYNNEKQYYSRARPENAWVKGGKLVITARKERLSGASDFGNQDYTSARLVTRGKASWRYGFFDIRAKLPCSLGTWPAIWMLGTKGVWPDDGEIDIMEQLGKTAAYKKEVLGTVHMKAYYGGNGKGSRKSVADACGAFHNYQLTWSADSIQVGVDGTNYFEYLNPKANDVTRWPFDNPQYLLLNVAMGGDLGGPIPVTFVADQMEIDYVRIYQK